MKLGPETCRGNLETCNGSACQGPDGNTALHWAALFRRPGSDLETLRKLEVGALAPAARFSVWKFPHVIYIVTLQSKNPKPFLEWFIKGSNPAGQVWILRVSRYQQIAITVYLKGDLTFNHQVYPPKTFGWNLKNDTKALGHFENSSPYTNKSHQFVQCKIFQPLLPRKVTYP